MIMLQEHKTTSKVVNVGGANLLHALMLSCDTWGGVQFTKFQHYIWIPKPFRNGSMDPSAVLEFSKLYKFIVKIVLFHCESGTTKNDQINDQFIFLMLLLCGKI